MPSPLLLVLPAVLASACAGAYPDSAKLRRDGVLNLYPFPRVGRGGPLAWEPLDDYLDVKPAQRAYRTEAHSPDSHNRQRQLTSYKAALSADSKGAFTPETKGAFTPETKGAFTPEKLDNLVYLMLRQARSPREGFESRDPGMWFGPRLGRSYHDDEDQQSN